MPPVYIPVDPRWISPSQAVATVVYSQQPEATLGATQLQTFRKIVDPFYRVLTDLLKLNHTENTNGYVFQPSDHAFNFAMNYAWLLRRQFIDGLPIPNVIPDGEGGIDLRWKLGNRTVNISCKSNERQKDFIYWKEQGGQYEGHEATLEILKERLRWLKNAA